MPAAQARRAPADDRRARAARGRWRSRLGLFVALEPDAGAGDRRAARRRATWSTSAAASCCCCCSRRSRSRRGRARAPARARRAPAIVAAVVRRGGRGRARGPHLGRRRARSRPAASPPGGLQRLARGSAVCGSTRSSSPAPTTRSRPPTARAGSSPTSGTTIERQLEDGIRLFLIDPHWGVEDAQGRVRTDFDAEHRDRNRVAELAAAGDPGGRRAARGQPRPAGRSRAASARSSSATRSASSARRGWSTRSR